jgi:hypothetical protein
MSFQINSYLQYKNTPDGKPRVLVEGVDYNCKWASSLKMDSELDGKYRVANLSDCIPLLSVDYQGKPFRSLTIVQRKKADSDDIRFVVFTGFSWGHLVPGTTSLVEANKYFFEEYANTKHFNHYSFESDPIKYSKLLWNCNEQDGWDKLYKLLGIK